MIPNKDHQHHNTSDVCACSNTQLHLCFGGLGWLTENGKEGPRILLGEKVFEVPSIVEDDIAYLTTEVLRAFMFDTNVT